MLVLTREPGQTIYVGEDVVITLLRLKGNTARIGIEAPAHVLIRRGELEPRTDRQDETD